MADNIFDDMTTYKAIGMAGKIMRKSHGKARFELNRKAEFVEFIESVWSDDTEQMGHRLKAAGHYVAMEGMNQNDEKLQAMIEMQQSRVVDDVKEEPKVILILPNNGSEVENG